MQLALYRAERPEVFEDIIGQKHIVRILKNQIRTESVSQAYLFSGTHGTGKTSTARILAKAVNCLEGIPGQEDGISLPCGHCANCEAIREGRFVDCIELDAASNNGVDDLRTIIDMVKYPPSVGRYKVYIIDEVHMLSPAAENAFLKTLEEPPEHAIFILATTDPQKVRSTIRSRCMQLNFKRVSEEELTAGMARICSKRGIEATKDALVTIASRADGSVRDALSILEQCMAAGDKHLDRNLVLEYTGAAGEDFYLALTDAVRKGDVNKVFIYIDEIIKRGKDAKQILKDWLTHYRDLLVVKYVNKPGRIIGYSAENIARLKEQADAMDPAQIERAIRLISEYINLGRFSERPRILLETAAVRLAGDPSSDKRASGAETGGLGITDPGALRTRGRETSAISQSAKRHSSVSGAERTAASTAAGTAGRVATEGSAPERSSEPERAISDPEPEYEPPESIAPAPREVSGDPAEMWGLIVDEITRTDRSFISFVGKHSAGTEFENGELVVTVRPNKMRLANDKLGDITRTAKALFGQGIFVTLRNGDPDEVSAVGEAAEQEVSRVIDEDINVNDIADDVENLFGIRPEISG